LSKTVRVYIVVAVLAVVGLYIGVQVLEQPLVGVLIAAIAVIGGLYLLNRESNDGDGFFSTPDSRGDDDDDDVDDAPEPPRRAPRSSTATAEPLATWEGEGLTPWTPPETTSDAEIEVVHEEEEEEFQLDAVDLEELDHIDDFLETETSAEPETVDEFDELDLDELLEPESEPEPVDDFDAFSTDSFSTDSFSTDSLSTDTLTDELATHDEVDESDEMLAELHELEDVHTSDDIMKASEATSLEHTGAAAGGADNSELAKLLAKVQSRLAAYE
jgi:hypothetical protein